MAPRVTAQAIDTTTILGAESLIRASTNSLRPMDPRAEKCAVTLINAILDADEICLLIPASHPEECQPETVHVLEAATGGDCPSVRRILRADVALSAKEDEYLAPHFLRVVNEVPWFCSWVAFQMTSQDVINLSPPTMDRLVFPDSRIAWESIKGEISRRVRPEIMRQLAGLSPVHDSLVDKRSGESLGDYALALAYGIVRRGLQYSNTIQLDEANAVYHPHDVRDRWFEFMSDWREDSSGLLRYYSWARYFIELLRSPASASTSPLKSVREVLQRVLRVRELERADPVIQCARSSPADVDPKELAERVTKIADGAILPRWLPKSLVWDLVALVPSAAVAVSGAKHAGLIYQVVKTIDRNDHLGRMGVAGLRYIENLRKGEYAYVGLLTEESQTPTATDTRKLLGP